MHVVIMAGGSGTRFWPASRKDKPKQFLSISNKDPMLVETCNRLRPLAKDEEMIIVLGEDHLEEARRLLGDRPVHFMAEPVGRNTAPCIGLGALYAAHLGSRDPIAFLPADHFIADPGAFLEDLKRASKIAESGAIVTLGIVPNRPETGYGYIRRSPSPSKPRKVTAYEVSAFVEKPDIHRAEQYVASGDYYWNAGIFVATAETILNENREHLPELSRGLDEINDALGEDRFERVLKKVYGDLDGVSFDYGIMEKTGRPVFVVPCECGWSDVGSWESLYALRRTEYDGEQNISEGEALIVDCKKSFISGQGGRLVACLGLEGCLVIDTPDALLVADLNRSQQIREIIERLKGTEKEDLL